MIIPLSTLLKHYKRSDIQQAMITCAGNREVAVKYGDKGFGKRPDIIRNPNDIIELAKNGATSFHVSEERWRDPLLLVTGQPRREMDELRTGWDLILDIDCKELRYSQIATHLLIEALLHHDITNVTCKFSGNHGFHIAVPFETFPEEVHGLRVASLFPEGPRRIAHYLKEKIRLHLTNQLADIETNLNTIASKAGVESAKLMMPNGEFDPFGALSIDTILLASRHLYRMPYSFNEKSGLVSIPIDPQQVLSFDREQARAECVEVTYPFLNAPANPTTEARELIREAFDFKIPSEKIETPPTKTGKNGKQQGFEELTFALQEDLFPPCMKLILAGISDGKKRAVFVLVNFLRSVGWDQAKIEERLREWNKNNPHGGLREQELLSPLRYHTAKNKTLPPNCNNQQYYIDIGVCKPDNLCGRIKNPAQYSLVKARAIAQHQPKEKRKKTTQ